VRLMEQHGENVSSHILDRIADLTEKGDHEGVQFWITISDRVRKLAGVDKGKWTQ
jgi:hypothetical protein